jgi:hypothetical protein
MNLKYMIKAVPMTVFEWICIKYKEQRRDEGEFIYRDLDALALSSDGSNIGKMTR